MTERIHDQQRGAALLIVLLGILILVSVGVFMMLAVDRNTDTRFAYQRGVAGFNAAEAGLHVGAGGVLTAMQNFGLPTNCSPQSFPLNGRTVTYTLSVPGNAPGDCTPSTTVMTLGSDNPYVGLNAIVHSYTLTSTATNAQGYTEASVSNKFFADLIPMFQFAAFYKNDLEVLPSPPAVINGRLHTNGNLYLNSDSCGSAISNGLNILGRITIVGTDPGNTGLYRGRKDSNQSWNNVYISLDGTGNPATMQVLQTSPGSGTSCAQVGTRQIPQAEADGFNGRISTHLTNITLPGEDTLLCTPWVTGCPATGGAYWQNANTRIVLDLTDAPKRLVPGTGPFLPPLKVMNPAGNEDGGKTDRLKQFLLDRPGALTYTDVPTSGVVDCSASCEPTYSNGAAYSPAFPAPNDSNCGGAGFPGRTPRQNITGSANYCNDYRFGGFFNWREHKPIKVLNLDWIALSEWNSAQSPGNKLFDQDTSTNGGIVVFLSIKGPNSSGGNNYGVRIFDAARLPRDSSNTGVTFATDTSAYVMGNFNCAAPDTSGGDSVPAACGAAKRPSSVIADSINVLSCAWIDPAGPALACANTYTTGVDQWAGVGQLRPLDERSTGPASGTRAAQTVINAAFLAGNDNTWCRPVTGNDTGVGCGSSTWYSGGLENYPRFHEDWQNGGPYKLWYQGSFVSIDSPRHTCWAVVAKGVANDPAFSCTTVPAPQRGFWTDTRYVPPPRRWFYDTSFDVSTNLPPLTPRFVYLQLVYFTQALQ